MESKNVELVTNSSSVSSNVAFQGETLASEALPKHVPITSNGSLDQGQCINSECQIGSFVQFIRVLQRIRTASVPGTFHPPISTLLTAMKSGIWIRRQLSEHNTYPGDAAIVLFFLVKRDCVVCCKNLQTQDQRSNLEALDVLLQLCLIDLDAASAPCKQM